MIFISHRRPVERIELRVPVIVMVLAATAIPVELRSPTYEASGFSVSASDVLANILGYVPVGIVLNDLGPFRAVTTAAVVGILAETAQLIMAHRDPSIVDVLSNVAGAVLGLAIASYWKHADHPHAPRREACSAASREWRAIRCRKAHNA